MPRGDYTIQGTARMTDETTGTVRKVQRSMRGFSSFLRNNFVVTLGDVARAAQAAYDRIFDTSRLEGQTASLRAQLESQGQSFDAFLAKLDEVAEGTISSADLIRASSQALLLGIPADRIAELLEVARGRAVATGRDVAQAFDDITTGIGRASPLILDNLGIVVNLTETYDEMASRVGKSAQELTQAEKSQALLNSVLEDGVSSAQAFIDAQSDTAKALEQARASLGNFQTGLGRLAGGLLPFVAEGFAKAARGILILADAALAGTGALTALLAKLPGIGEQFGAAERAIRDWRIALLEVQVPLQQLDDEMDEVQEGLGGLSGVLRSSFSGFQSFGQAAKGAGAAIASTTSAAREAQVHVVGLTEKNAELADSETQVANATINATNALSVHRQRLLDIERQAERTTRALAFTSAQFDRLAATSGRGAAVDAAVAAGGELVLGGTRVNLPGGGSRLVRPPGLRSASGFGF